MHAGKKEIVLSWEQRLRIAIDAAQGSLINEQINLKKFSSACLVPFSTIFS